MRKWLLVGSMCAVLSMSGCSGGDDSGTAAGSEQEATAGSGQETTAASDQGATTGNGQGGGDGGDAPVSITGKWSGPKGAPTETFEFRDDGTMSLSNDGTTCDGTVEDGDEERAYTFEVDCGTGAYPGSAVVSPDGKTVTLIDPDGEKSVYERVSG